LDNPLHVILNNSKLAYRIYVILIANKELIKKKIYIYIYIYYTRELCQSRLRKAERVSVTYHVLHW
jgi:hypothetical protein